MTSWPGDNRKLEKVPSIIAYEEDKTDFSVKAWGYDVLPEMNAYSWFKLRMVQNDEAGEHDDPLLRQSAGQGLLKLPPGRIADEVCRDYLRCVYTHILKKLNEEFKSVTMNEMPFKFVLTTPAGWSDHAKTRIQSSAESAGFGSREGDTVRMIDEPEAAALAAFEKSGKKSGAKDNTFEVRYVYR